MIKFLLPLFIFVGLFTRFFNLSETGIFHWDQSIDLVKIHQYAVDRTLTLVGPISEDGSKVFGSLTYYMLMPFAVLGDFEPLSTTLGGAFWGFLTYLLVIVLTGMINKKLVLWVSALGAIWFPLVEISRSAWNPYLMPFWIVLGLIFYQLKKPLTLFLSGVFLGLSIHNHYVAFFAAGMFILLSTLASFKKSRFLNLYLILGFCLTILPFIVFDFRHPPGLFLSRVVYFNHVDARLSLNILDNIWTNWQTILHYYTHNTLLSFLLAVSGVSLLIYDFKTKNAAIIYGLVFIFQLIIVALLADSFIHYFLPALIFFLAWIMSKRSPLGASISKLVFAVLLTGSLFTISNQLLIPSWIPDIKSIKEITNILDNEIKRGNLKNANLAVLGSVDNNTYGRKYRDLLLIKGVNLLSRDEYFRTDNLFIVTQSSQEKIRNDDAIEMQLFRRGFLRGQWYTSSGDWKVYLFNKNTYDRGTLK